MKANAQRLLSPSEIRPLLAAEAPQWGLETGEPGLRLTRTFRTSSWSMTLHAANVAGFVAEVGWHHPTLILDYKTLTVELRSHDVGGVTRRDVELALRIEAALTWLPAAGQALSGHAKRQVR